MFSPLLQSIITRHNLRVVADTDLDVVAREHEHVMLFIPGDADRLAESNDVAVILPELVAVLRGHVTALVASRESERALQRRFRFSAFPALVLLRRGQYLGAIARVRDWSDYLDELSSILSRAPSEPPPFKLPVAPPSRGSANGVDHGGDDHDLHDHH